MPSPILALSGASLASGVMQSNAASKAAKASQKAADASTALQRDIFNQTTANYAPFLDAGKSGLAAYLYEMNLGPAPMTGGTAPNIETINTAQDGGTGMGGPLSGTSGTIYRVNGQDFQTLEEAQKFANENKTGGETYGGYMQSPMAKYLMEQGVDSIEGSASARGGLYSGSTLKALEDSRRKIISADTSDYFSKLFGLANMGMGAAGNQANAGSAYANNVSNLNMANAQNQGNAYQNSANAWGNTLSDISGIYGYFSNPMAAYASPTMATTPRANPFY